MSSAEGTAQLSLVIITYVKSPYFAGKDEHFFMLEAE